MDSHCGKGNKDQSIADDTALFLRDASWVPVAISSTEKFSKAFVFFKIGLNVSYFQLKYAAYLQLILFQIGLGLLYLSLRTFVLDIKAATYKNT